MSTLPFGVARGVGCVTAQGDDVIDLTALATHELFEVPAGVFAQSSLNQFLGLGREVVISVGKRVAALIEAGDERVQAASTPAPGVTMLRPVTVGDFVDFSSSLHHATNMGRLLRPSAPGGPLPRDWYRFPRGYHGRAASIVVSGTDVVRPVGHVPAGLCPTEALDFEAEVAFVIGPGTRLGERITVDRFEEHAIGLLLLNDWSARDFQRFESVPLGPFLGKSFATSVSPWVVPLDGIQPPDIRLEVTLQSAVMRHAGMPPAFISRPSFADMYWSLPQLLAHATVNGAPVRPGDLFASGTVSGPDPGTHGCLMELTDGGTRPIELPDGSSRTFLADGDTVTVRGRAGTVSLGEVAGTVLPALALEV